MTEWLKSFLTLSHGIPSLNTFGRVFTLLDPKQLQACFVSWVNSLITTTVGEIIALDGKTLRRSYGKAGTQSAIHMVSAWASHNHLVLGRLKVEEKSSEVKAILELLDIQGATITLDAMGCQKTLLKKF